MKRIAQAEKRRGYIDRLAAEATRMGKGSPSVLYAPGVEPNDSASVHDFFAFLSDSGDLVLRTSARSALSENH